jgi:hypothetical protein
VIRAMQLVSLLPTPLSRAVAKLNTKGARMHDSMQVPNYTDVWQHGQHGAFRRRCVE